ncbi:MAG: phosphoribosylglycinamide formyltransferase [Anaerolineaceae bacterium]|nr:phosphoribosylglycinamide formyltransferase [Anaerolineaceae bacterium]
MAKKRLALLISGNGSNLQAIINACQNEIINAEVVVVISNRKDAYGLKKAEKAAIPAIYHPYFKGSDRNLYDDSLSKLVLQYTPDFVVLAGWMRKLSMHFLRYFPMKVVNIHPALPDTFPGTHAIERAFHAYQEGEITQSGVMIHYVPDEGVDDGPILLQKIIKINPEDQLADFEDRIHETEHHLFTEVLCMLCNNSR